MLDLPTRYMGVQIDSDYVVGVWVFNFDATYSTVTWTAPDGNETSAKIT